MRAMGDGELGWGIMGTSLPRLARTFCINISAAPPEKSGFLHHFSLRYSSASLILSPSFTISIEKVGLVRANYFYLLWLVLQCQLLVLHHICIHIAPSYPFTTWLEKDVRFFCTLEHRRRARIPSAIIIFYIRLYTLYSGMDRRRSMQICTNTEQSKLNLWLDLLLPPFHSM